MKKSELHGLMADLKGELGNLSDTHESQAQSIAVFAKASSSVMREPQHEELIDLSMAGLKLSAAEFEASHPQLARTINAICIALSKAGI